VFAFWLPPIESEALYPTLGPTSSGEVSGSAAAVPSASWEQQEGDDSANFKESKAGHSRSWLVRGVQGLGIMCLFQFILVWISVKDLVGVTMFWVTLSSLLAALLSSGILIAAVVRRSNQETWHIILKHSAPAMFLFLYNAAPSAGYELYTYQFYLFYAEAPCKMTYLSLISSSASVLAYGLYALALNQRGIRLAIVLTAALGVLVGLLWLPLASLDLVPGSEDPVAGACVDLSFVPHALAPTCLSPFTYAAVVQFISGISGVLVLTPSTVLATESTPHEHRTTAYAIYLSLIDSGESASGWITSTIVTRLKLSYDNWGRLSDLIWIGACSQLAMLVLVPFLCDVKAAVPSSDPAVPSGDPAVPSGNPETYNCFSDDAQLKAPLVD
jgi:hypothetical protein